jgi:hypothetical protein
MSSILDDWSATKVSSFSFCGHAQAGLAVKRTFARSTALPGSHVGMRVILLLNVTEHPQFTFSNEYADKH